MGGRDGREGRGGDGTGGEGFCRTNQNMAATALSCCYLCVKWLTVWSGMFRANFGVRQGSALSPFLFAVYLGDLAKLCNTKSSVFIILHADDILLLAPSVCELDCSKFVSVN